MAGEKDPFGRTLDSYPPLIMTEEEARRRMREVALQDAATPEEMTDDIKRRQDEEIDALEHLASEDEDDVSDLDDDLEGIEDADVEA